MTFQDDIKKYVILDNEIKEISNRLKSLRQEKNIYNKRIITYIKNNELEEATIKINDGKLNFINTPQNQILTFRYLESCFNKFFKNQPEISNLLLNFIKNEREIKFIKEIKRTYN
tara:strand:- start:2063 stop:2407 length:345 start_codon:yes stop_codon:yes gene_type:complete